MRYEKYYIGNTPNHKLVDNTTTEEDFKRTVSNYLSWKISNLMKGTV